VDVNPSGSMTARSNTALECEVTSFRRSGFDLTKPLLYVEKSCESPEFLPVKNAVRSLISSLIASKDITTASVYIRDFEHSRWTGVGENEGYHPGSLSKVPLLISYLYQSESDPSLLDKQYEFQPPTKGTLPVQNYYTNTIVAGKKYTVRELLRYMIQYSDNNATWLLSQKIGLKAYEKTFIDLGVNIPLPDGRDSLVLISPRDYSVFFRALYNSSYLVPELSEYALALLGKSTFSEGFVTGLPEGTKVVHKFAEWDNGDDYELHESGIFYVKGKAYLVTIMTKGKNRSKLPNVIASLTRTIYGYVAVP
jgi:beta-lactamase class A